MAEIPLTIGVDEIDSLSPRLIRAIEIALHQVGDFLENRIKDNISKTGPPVKGDFPRSESGALAASISFTVNGLELRVKTNAPQALKLELGDYPFMGRTLKESEAEIAQIFTQALQESFL